MAGSRECAGCNVIKISTAAFDDGRPCLAGTLAAVGSVDWSEKHVGSSLPSSALGLARHGELYAAARVIWRDRFPIPLRNTAVAQRKGNPLRMDSVLIQKKIHSQLFRTTSCLVGQSMTQYIYIKTVEDLHNWNEEKNNNNPLSNVNLWTLRDLLGLFVTRLHEIHTTSLLPID